MKLGFPEFSRELRRGEEPAVEALLERAFGGLAEARPVAALRRSGAIAGEVVLPFKGDIVGYYALSQMRAPKGWLCLAPVAIDPAWQGAGHGRRLIGMLAEWARLSGSCVLAAGPHAFLARAGFRPMAAADASPQGEKGQTMLAGPSGDAPNVELIYPAAFGPA